mmetsp:Transcript_8443/g.9728  ORF Transcript_8443/g.9728 Transcript_8443/m.9728 type:complete len:90 (-) Transcript_8443:33-302(-)
MTVSSDTDSEWLPEWLSEWLSEWLALSACPLKSDIVILPTQFGQSIFKAKNAEDASTLSWIDAGTSHRHSWIEVPLCVPQKPIGPSATV